MMKKHIKWLHDEIDLWVNEGVIGPDQGTALRRRYPAPAESTAWSRIIFFSIGAILFGLGVILIFAYNWERMHKFVKLAVIFAALLGAHGAGFWLKRPQSRHPSAGEGLHLLGTMLFGAGIWLIAQVYHIEEHYPNAFLIWGLGALALAWSMPSVAHGILAAILLVLWNCFEVFDFKNPQLISPFLLLGGIMPLAWLRRSRILMTVGLIGFLLTLFASVSTVEGDLAALVLFLSASMLIAASLVVRQRNLFAEISPVLSFIGFFLFFAILFILSFYHRGKGTWSVQFDQFLQSLFFFSFALAAIGMWAWAIWPTPKTKGQPAKALSAEYFGVMATLCIMILNTLGLLPLRGWLGMAVFNILFLYQCVMMIITGCRTLSLKMTVTGCVLFAAIALARYTDLFFSLLARSLVFFIAGAALFAVGIYYSKTKKQIERETI
ncbi:MAG: DUF2157 domain-containing protein [Desulfobacterales bacterium]|jgi:uncharacterized membrane protein